MIKAVTASAAWLEANHVYLSAALERVQRSLEQYIGRTQQRTLTPGASRGDAPAATAPADAPPALDVLCEAFGLTPFERDILLLCAGVELDMEIHAACGSAQGLAGRAPPTFGLALAALPAAHWSALAPQAPLRRGCLLTLLPGDSLVQSPLRIEERVLHYLTGLTGPAARDARLCAILTPKSPPAALPSSQVLLVRTITQRVTSASTPEVKVTLCGADAADRAAVAAAVCAELALELHVLRATDIPVASVERDLIGRLWDREQRLERCALLIEIEDADESHGETLRAALSLVERAAGLVLISSRAPLRTMLPQLLRFDVIAPTADEQRALWQQALDKEAVRGAAQIDPIVTHFRMGTQTIAAAAQHAATRFGDGAGADFGPLLWDACRAQARPRLDELAQRIDSKARFADLVLPAPQQEILRTIIAHIQHQDLVHKQWGFAARTDRGRGVSALFAGPSGTGKTLAAEVLANELRLDLYRIDLSQVVSKYIGETEKNLRRVFDAAEQGGAVLLFDEADALFGKRSEVKDSHDRYANIEVSYLLQRMESYQGVSILTTNMRSALDTAFLRRLRVVVHFPFPNQAQRIEIWRRVIPSSAPTEGVDLAQLARLNVSGGHIANIAVGAAYAAAADGEPLRMRHFLAAARLEYTKIDETPSDNEVGGWV